MAEDIKQPFRIGFLLINEFALMSFSAVIEPLRAANLISEKILYKIDYFSITGNSSKSSSGAVVNATAKLDETSNMDILFVVAGFGSVSFKNESIFKLLRKLNKQGVFLGGVSGGPVILAYAGVMRNRRLTVHWEHASALRESMPDLIIERSLYVKDRDRYTCAGGIAPMDMMNTILTEHHGAKFAQKVSDWFIHTEIRPSAGPQRSGLTERYPAATQPVILAIEAMRNHIADPLDLEQLARLSEISTRQLNRLFNDKLGCKTMDFYRNLRLETAQKLLCQSSMKIIEVAQATGFVSAAHFSASFHKAFAQTPTQMRSKVQLKLT
jgi:transcriptional regulator GlxA family with amidase domain